MPGRTDEAVLRRDAGAARALAARCRLRYGDCRGRNGRRGDRCALHRRSTDLITRDRHLEARAHGPVRVIRLTANRVEEQARALPGIDWQYAPFTRCLVDNAPLSPAPPEMADQVPSDSRAAGGPLQVCPECGRLYWPGGHVRRMADMLRRLASA